MWVYTCRKDYCVGKKNYTYWGKETGVIGNYIPNKVVEKQSLNLGDVEKIRKELYKTYHGKRAGFSNSSNIFTDKSLDNFFYLELIKEIFPNSKIINCKRNPLSSIISIFQNNLTKLHGHMI